MQYVGKGYGINTGESEKRQAATQNILPFGESTLLEHKIKQLKDCEAVSDIIVSPDSDKMLKMAQAQGVEAWKRTEKYTLDEVPFGRVR